MDIPALEALIARSASALGAGYYDAAQNRAAVDHVFGVDSTLVADGTYYLIEEAGAPIACGGWSRRRTLFGGDRFAAREDAPLDPETDAARIRAFFVAPEQARRGLASALLDLCQQAALDAGFGRLDLMATLPGVPFYAARGFVADTPIAFMAGTVMVPFVPMSKDLHDGGDLPADRGRTTG